MPISKKQLKLTGLAVVLLIVILACGPNTAVTPTLDQNSVATAIQQTMIAHTLAALDASQSGGQQSSGDQGQAQQPPTVTNTVAVITETPSLTPLPPNTVTPSVPMVNVSVNTNCRFGPGKEYELLGALLVGEQSQIIARDPSGYYWYIQNPDKGGFCWLWGNYATTSGNVASLPVFTPPATSTPTATNTPKPEFTVVYDHLDDCGVWVLSFKISNTGSLVWQSVSVTVTDTVTTEAVNWTDDQFKEFQACILNLGTLQNDLGPTEVGFSPSEGLSADPSGHQIDATIKVCTEDGLGGTCLTKNISFTP
jgi:hypothetical protein